MYFGQALISNTQTAKSVQPREHPFDRPAIYTQATAMLGSPFGQYRNDTTGAELKTVRLGIMATITPDAIRAGSAHLTSDLCNRINQWYQLGNVMSAGQDRSRWYSLPVRDKVMFAPQLPSILRIGARFARTEELSTTALDRSILSASLSSANKSLCNFTHTPAFCHCRNLLRCANQDLVEIRRLTLVRFVEEV